MIWRMKFCWRTLRARPGALRKALAAAGSRPTRLRMKAVGVRVVVALLLSAG
jgi:hypothetical protein